MWGQRMAIRKRSSFGSGGSHGLYCPDEVIRLGNRFLDTVKKKEVESTDEQKETALAKLVLELRRDMIGKVKTCLKVADFKTWRSLD